VSAVSQLRGSTRGRWLDVGFGDGALLSTAAEFGYDVLGLDLREECVRRMRDFGFRAERRELCELDESERFEVVSLCDVLEHMPFPRRELERVARLLAPNGHALVSTPNHDSFAWQWLDRQGQNPYWRELEHYHNFGRERLFALLAECGLEPCHFAVSERYRAGMEVIAKKR
jgi:2-polyprenyl-3-methyl-5-hydroxy-6-metoxy-1,4-benzoquinol methylase